jgi:protein-L-isoaspartate(D-aspartate) O-methyltransferase
MVQLLSLDGNERVLDIGTGSGYQAAVLSYLAAEVYSIERYAELAEQASQRLRYLKFRNIHIHVGDGTEGLDQHAPFDRIVVAAGAPEAPPPLLEQLAEGGALVIPVGGRNNQILQRWVRFGDTYEREDFVPVAFVPLIGKYGW